MPFNRGTLVAKVFSNCMLVGCLFVNRFVLLFCYWWLVKPKIFYNLPSIIGNLSLLISDQFFIWIRNSTSVLIKSFVQVLIYFTILGIRSTFPYQQCLLGLSSYAGFLFQHFSKRTLVAKNLFQDEIFSCDLILNLSQCDPPCIKALFQQKNAQMKVNIID